MNSLKNRFVKKQKCNERQEPSVHNPHEVFDRYWDTKPRLLSEKQAAVLLGVSLSYLRKSRSEGTHHKRTEAPLFVRVGGRVYYRAHDLRAWIETLEGRARI
jgi:hypothetical protein